MPLRDVDVLGREPAAQDVVGVGHQLDSDTGQVTLTDVLQVADVGTIINPVAHDGQLKGVQRASKVGA